MSELTNAELAANLCIHADNIEKMFEGRMTWLSAELREAAQRLEAREEISEAKIDVMALAAYRQSCHEAERGQWWSEESEETRTIWRKIIRAALEAAQKAGTTPEKIALIKELHALRSGYAAKTRQVIELTYRVNVLMATLDRYMPQKARELVAQFEKESISCETAHE